MIDSGMTVKAVAAALGGITPNTVYNRFRAELKARKAEEGNK